MRVEELTVEVRNSALNRIGQIAPGDLVLECYPEHNGVGSWKVTLPIEHPLVSTLTSPGAGVIITGPDDVILSGPYLTYEFNATTDDALGTVSISGVGDNVLLADALAWPDPSNADAETQATAYDERTGSAESLMHAYVNANIGPDGPVGRRWDNLHMGTDGGRGASVTKQARFPQLSSLLAELAGPDGLGFRIVQRGRLLVFETYKTGSLAYQLSIDHNTAASLNTTVSAPSVTRVVVGAAGDGVDRQFIYQQTTDSIAAEAQWNRRIEQFIDQRAVVGDPDAQARSALEALASGGTTVVSAKAVAAEDTTFEYGQQWFLGDSVSVALLESQLQAPITGLALLADSNGVRQGLVLGDPTKFSTEARIDVRTRSIEARLSRLERAQ